MSRHWFQLPERGTPAAIGLIRWIALHIGRDVARLLLYPITVYFFVTAPAPRRMSRDYLRRVFGREPGWLDIVRHFHCFAATILDRVYFLAGRSSRFDVRIHDGEILLAQVRAARGCLLLGAHVGSFEVLRALGVTERRLPIKVLMNTDHNETILRLLNELNPEIAETVIPIGGPESLLKVKESLDQGFLIGALGDRVAASDKVTRCRFLGAEASFPAGPILLAAAAQVPVILMFGLYRGGNRYDVYFEPLAERVTLDRERRSEAIQRWTQRYAERLEHYVKIAPYNWFNFYDYWNEAPRAT